VNTLVVIDGDHYLYSLRSVQKSLDHNKLLRFLKATEGDVVGALYYISDPGTASFAQDVARLSDSGWDVRTIPLVRVPGSNRRVPRGYDTRMVAEVLTHPASFDRLVLFSGDSDFAPLIQVLRQRGVSTKVFALPSATASPLQTAADTFCDLSQIEILPELLDDFIRAAEEFLKKGLKDPAAALLGARLENALRQLCVRRKLQIDDNGSLDSLNNRLGAAGTYDKLTKKTIVGWGEIRNAVAHGLFEEYSKADVNAMLSWMKQFVNRFEL
jgi:uncharacterized LabA/DUF88 family protein